MALGNGLGPLLLPSLALDSGTPCRNDAVGSKGLGADPR